MTLYSKKLLSLFVAPWSLTAVLLLGVSLGAHTLIRPPLGNPSLLDWVISFALSCLIWIASNLVREKLLSSPKQRLVAGILCAPALAIGITASVMLYARLGEYLKWGMIHYALKSGSGSMQGFATTYTTWEYGTLALVLCVILGLIWGKMPPLGLSKKHQNQSLVTTVTLIVASVFLLTFSPPLQETTPDVALLTASFQATVKPTSLPLAQDSPDTPPAPVTAPDAAAQPDLILVIHESLGTQELTWYSPDAKPQAMPWLSKQIQDAPHSWHIAQHAYTLSTTTHLSVPALWTGVHPLRGTIQRAKAPMLWQWAKAAGYQTVLATSQCYSWGEFKRFVDRSRPDHFIGCDKLPNADPVNDAGVGELKIANLLDQPLKKLDPNKPLLLIYNSNALHQPFQTSSPHHEFRTLSLTDYQKALRLVDHAMKELWNTLDNTRRDRPRVMLMTADHGEHPSPTHDIPRVESYYEEFVRIPMILHASSSELITQTLQTNLKERNVSNLDILPTMIDLMGFDTSTLPTSFDGQSLLHQHVPKDRTLIITNVSASRQWHHQGELVVQGPWRLIQSDLTGTQLFDIRQGREQTPSQQIPKSKALPQMKKLAKRACTRHGKRSLTCTARWSDK